jgi:hypothetical protein
MNCADLLAKTDRTREEDAILIEHLTDVLKKSSLLAIFLHKVGSKVLRSRSNNELRLYVDLQESIARISRELGEI